MHKAVLLVLKLSDIPSLAPCSLLLVQESHAEVRWSTAVFSPYCLVVFVISDNSRAEKVALDTLP